MRHPLLICGRRDLADQSTQRFQNIPPIVHRQLVPELIQINPRRSNLTWLRGGTCPSLSFRMIPFLGFGLSLDASNTNPTASEAPSHQQ
jgi:hypothetical protein